MASERFETLWAQHRPQVVVLARREAARYGLSEDDAEDLVQETGVAFFHASERLGLFKIRTFLKGSLIGYLRGIVTKRAVSLARSRARRPLVSASELADGDATIDELIGTGEVDEDTALVILERLAGEQNAAQLRETIERLPDKQRDAVQLVRLRGATYKEAAEVLGVPVGTVKSQVHDALKTLRRTARLDEGEA